MPSPLNFWGTWRTIEKNSPEQLIINEDEIPQFDYRTTIHRVPHKDMYNYNLRRQNKDGSVVTYAKHSGYQADISAQGLNAALARGIEECPECTHWYLAIKLSRFVGVGRNLPISDYGSIFTLGKNLAYSHTNDGKGNLKNFRTGSLLLNAIKGQ